MKIYLIKIYNKLYKKLYWDTLSVTYLKKYNYIELLEGISYYNDQLKK